MSYLGMLDQVAAHQRVSLSQSAGGDTIQTWTELDAEVPCSVQRSSGGRVYVDSGWIQVERWKGFFLPEQGVQIADRIVATGLTYEVLSVETIRRRVCQAELRIVGAA